MRLNRASYQCAWNGTVFAAQETFTGERAGWLSFTERDPAVRDADRQQCVCHARSLYVCACDRGTYSGEKL